MRTLTRAQRKSSNAERVPRSTPEVLTFPRVLHLVGIICAINDTVMDDVNDVDDVGDVKDDVGAVGGVGDVDDDVDGGSSEWYLDAEVTNKIDCTYNFRF